MIYDIQKSILYALFVYLIDTNERSFRYIMSGSTFGTLFRVTTWGESHGPGVGVVIDGCPAGIPLSEQDIQQFLDRRKPGQSKYTTKRNESDSVEILALDYVVSKMARFPFDKLEGASNRLSTQMKATGEVMSVGRTIEESLLKAVRSLEIGVCHIYMPRFDNKPVDELLDT